MKEKKKELGQFFTSDIIADFMSSLVIDKNTKSVLDPAVGEGVFLKSCEKNKKGSLSYTAFDIDDTMIDLCSKLDLNLKLNNEDYLLSNTKEPFDAIICNPPYNKFQEIPNRKNYISIFQERYGIQISGYSNLYVYFLIKSINEMSSFGKCVYIIPYEFLNTGYGNSIKQYILNDKRLKEIYRFDNNISLFDDALTTSCILLFDSKKHEHVNFIGIKSINEIKDKKYSYYKEYNFDELNPNVKWNEYFNNNKDEYYRNLVSLSSVAKVKRGIATGNNSFFALSKSQINDLKISKETCVKCVCKSPDINTIVFTDKEYNNLVLLDKKVYIFDGERAITESDKRYISYGEQHKVNEGYLNAHRKPWFSIEKKEIAPIWVSVFNRNSIKFIRNETSCRNLTTFHGVYINENYLPFINIIFCYLLTPIAQEILHKNKREYGDGLEKFEPNDLNKAQIIDVTVISSEDIENINYLYNQIKKSTNLNQCISMLDDIFKKYIK